MPNTHLYPRGWTDLDPSSRFRNMAPNVIILADNIANGEYDGLAGDVFNGDTSREVVYVDDDGNRWDMVLRLHKHPTGAGSLTIHNGTASTCRGKLMGKDGAYVQDAEDVDNIAGGMLSHYCETTSLVGSSTSQQPVWSTAIAEGDHYWVVQSGKYHALADDDALAAAGLNLVTGNGGGTDGAVEPSVSTIASLAEIQENITGLSGKCIGRSLEAKGATTTGYVTIELDLPVNHLGPSYT